uniref:GSK3-beta interaction protein n=2 Tax=Cacopsylla melanoneura TaxID=428564 RepID=A0A8D8REF8_9HEMI
MTGGIMTQRGKSNFLEEYAPRKKKIKCFFCGRKDHYSDKCEERGNTESRLEFMRELVIHLPTKMNDMDTINWRDEANHVIQDIRDLVQMIQISDQQPDDNCIYLNMITKERKDYTIKLCQFGFCIVARKINSPKPVNESDNVVYYETPYSLLASVSGSYYESFGNKLRTKLEKLQANPVYAGRE